MATNKIKCLVVDDEPFAARLMQDEIGKIPFLEFVASCSSANKALPYLEVGVDLMFLDVQMPQMTGVQFLRTLQNPPMVIMTTAFEKYALDGFDLNVVDYLMKPIVFERFEKAANKARELFLLRNAKPAGSGSSFLVRSNYKQIKLFTDDVLYIEGLKDYVKIFTVSSPHPILTRQNLKGMESIIPPHIFCRIHNSYIVNLSKVTTFQKAHVFIGKKELPIGEKFAESFERIYKQV